MRNPDASYERILQPRKGGLKRHTCTCQEWAKNHLSFVAIERL